MQKENILDEIYSFLARFIWFPSDHYRVATAAWIAHTYLTTAFEELGFATPRLAILSPEKRSGKTRLLEITKLLARNAQSMISPSAASLYTLISEVKPTVLIDEIGRVLEKKDISEFFAIVEAGFQPGQSVPRVSLDPVRKVENFKLYAPMLMAGIDNGRMPDTITDRSIILRMRRKIGQRLPYRPRKHAAEGIALAGQLSEWATGVTDLIKEIEPVMPDKLNDREQDKWEALFIVGHLADTSVTRATSVTSVTGISGGLWLDRIRRAALELSNEDKEVDTTSNGELLLKNLSDIINNNEFGRPERNRTSELLAKLNAIDEAPWSSFNYGKALEGNALAKLLRPYGIKPKTIRFEKETDKGYYTSDFEDAWKRYLPTPPEMPVTQVTEVTLVTQGDRVIERDRKVYQKIPVTPVTTITGVTSSLKDFEHILS